MEGRAPIREAVPARGGVPPAERTGWETGRRQVTLAVHRRDHLAPGQVLHGPVIVEEVDSTTFVPSHAVLTVDPSGSLIIHFEKGARV